MDEILREVQQVAVNGKIHATGLVLGLLAASDALHCGPS
jgi:hypothetical protein